MPQISINEPCHQKWGLMQKQDDGRFCSSCEKTVVDFTKMSTAEMKLYFLNKKGEEVCGHCRIDQVVSPKGKFIRWITSGLTLLFGVSLISSCIHHVEGKMSAYPSKKEMREQNKKEAKYHKGEK